MTRKLDDAHDAPHHDAALAYGTCRFHVARPGHFQSMALAANGSAAALAQILHIGGSDKKMQR